MGCFASIEDISHWRLYGWGVIDEDPNAFGGFLFSGPDDALGLLSEAAERECLRLMAIDLGDNVIRLSLSPEHSFRTAGLALVNRAQTGEFGIVSLGVFGGTTHSSH